MIPACGPPRSLSPLKGDHVRPRPDNLLDRGLPLESIQIKGNETAAPQIIHHGNLFLLPQRHQFFQANLIGESEHLEVACVDLENHSGGAFTAFS